MWVQVPADCYYADPVMVWVPTVDGKGVLFYTHGQWYSSEPGQTCSAPTGC